MLFSEFSLIFTFENSGLEFIRHLYIYFISLLLEQLFVKRPRSWFHFGSAETESPIHFEMLAGGHTTRVEAATELSILIFRTELFPLHDPCPTFAVESFPT